jgi:hypothetical protein
MGYYINENSKGETLSACGKVRELIKDGAKLTDESFKENLVCVVDNFTFDAAAYMFSEHEFDYFKESSSSKTWLVHPKAKELAK